MFNFESILQDTLNLFFHNIIFQRSVGVVMRPTENKLNILNINLIKCGNEILEDILT
jgi:hypothetical protein